MGGDRGTALAIVLWAVIILTSLVMAAGMSARLDFALAGAYRDHAAALALAEAGLAEARAEIAFRSTDPGLTDSLSGTLGPGTYAARWEQVADAYVVVAWGLAGRAVRRIEVRLTLDANGDWQIAAWREVL